MTGQEFMWFVFPWIGTAVCLAWLLYDKYLGKYADHRTNKAKPGKNIEAE